MEGLRLDHLRMKVASGVLIVMVVLLAGLGVGLGTLALSKAPLIVKQENIKVVTRNKKIPSTSIS